MSSASNSNQRSPDGFLLELYKMAIETDRHELELGWKLVQFFPLSTVVYWL